PVGILVVRKTLRRKALMMSSRNSAAYTTIRAPWLVLTIILTSFQLAFASPQQSPSRIVSGTVVDDKGQVLPGIGVIASGKNGEWRASTNATCQCPVEIPK